MFKYQIGRSMEVYVDDLLMKIMEFRKHMKDLKEAFEVLHQYKMKLNPTKCTFRVQLENFLGFIVSDKGIEENPEKLRAIIEVEYWCSLEGVFLPVDPGEALRQLPEQVILKKDRERVVYWESLRRLATPNRGDTIRQERD